MPWPPVNGYKAKLSGFLAHLRGDWDLIFGDDGSSSVPAWMRQSAGALVPVQVQAFRRFRALTTGVLPSNARLPWSDVAPHVEQLLDDGAEYDVAHLDTFSMAHLAQPMSSLFAERRRTTKIVCSPNDSYSLLLKSDPTIKRRVQSRVARLFESRFYRHADFVDVVSTRDVTWLRGGITNTEVRLIPLGVDVRVFQGPRPTPRWDVLYVGGTSGVETWVRILVDAVLPQVKAMIPGLRVALAGPRPHKWLSDQCRSHGWAHLGFVEDLPNLLRSSRMLVVPSGQLSGTPTKALEAMAAGTPVVGMQMLDGIVNGRDGVSYARASNWSELVERMNRVLSDDLYANRLAKGGRSLVKHEHDWASVVRKYFLFPDVPSL